MDVDSTAERKSRQSRRTAQASCLVFGLALLVWGLAPAFVQRLATGRSPTLQALAVGSLSLVIGLAFLWLALLIGRQKPWALWAALLASTVVLLGALAFTLLAGVGALSVFPVVLAGCTALTSWLALDTRRAAELVLHAAARSSDRP